MDDCSYEDWNNWVGERVCTKGTMFGTLRYFGETSFSSGIWCGIELDDSLGKNNGTVSGVKYFTCKPNYGIFVPISKVTKLSENPDEIKENICEANQNKTFDIVESHANLSSAEINNLNKELFACNNLVDEAIMKANNNLSKLRMDSEESLGILCSDELENSWDSLIPDYSLGNISLPSHQFDINCVQDFFTQPYMAARKENVFSDIISCPKYASTPRQIMKNKFVGHVHDLKANLSLEMGVETDDKVFADETVQNSSNVFFDFDKFKDNPNLSSTSKTQLDFDSPIQVNKENFSFENKISNVNQQNNLNMTQTFSKQPVGLAFETDPLNTTFALVDIASCIASEHEIKKSFDNEIKNIQMKETTNCDKNLNCTFKKEDLNTTNEFNLNATYELKFPGSSCQNYPHKKELTNNLLGTVNILNKLESINAGQNVENEEVTLDNVFLVEKKNSSDSSSVKDKLTNLFNDIKGPNSSESKIDKASTPEVIDNILLLEEKFAINTNTVNEKFNDTDNQDINNSDKVVKKNCFKKESFSYKNKFLKELDKVEKSSSSRKSISLPFNNDRRSMNIPKNYDKSLNLNSTFCLRNEKVNSGKSFSQISRKSLSEAPKNKTNVTEKLNSEFKKPFAPHSFVRSSKLASKPQSFISSKIRTSQLPKSCFKETSGYSKSLCNTSYEIKVNSFDDPDASSNKSDHRNLPNTRSKLPLNSRHSLTTPTKVSGYSCNNSSLTVPEKSTLLNTTCVLPLKEENGNSDELISKPCSNLSRFYSKTTVSNTRDVKKNCRETNSSNVLKSVARISDHQGNNNKPKQLKAPNNAQNSIQSKLPKKIHTLNISTEENQIPRRSSLSSYSLEKLPVGIVKPRSSLLQPIKFVNNGKLESQRKCLPSLASHSIEKAEVKTKQQFVSGTVQSLKNIKTDASKRNIKLKV